VKEIVKLCHSRGRNKGKKEGMGENTKKNDKNKIK